MLFRSPVKELSSNPALGIDVACAGCVAGTKDPIKNSGTKIHAALRVKAYLILSSIFNRHPLQLDIPNSN